MHSRHKYIWLQLCIVIKTLCSGITSDFLLFTYRLGTLKSINKITDSPLCNSLHIKRYITVRKKTGIYISTVRKIGMGNKELTIYRHKQRWPEDVGRLKTHRKLIKELIKDENRTQATNQRERERERERERWVDEPRCSRIVCISCFFSATVRHKWYLYQLIHNRIICFDWSSDI